MNAHGPKDAEGVLFKSSSQCQRTRRSVYGRGRTADLESTLWMALKTVMLH
jgi:hypothetical protein